MISNFSREKLEDRIVFLADSQFAGKGRGGNVWNSPNGSLLFSFKAYSYGGSSLPMLQYLICLALIDSISRLPLKDGNSIQLANRMKIKWPNDIYVDKLKVAGILIQSTLFKKKFDITIGVGLNVLNQEPTCCLQSVLSTFSNEKISKEMILASFLNTVESYLTKFEVNGFSPFEKAYYQRWAHRYLNFY